MSGFVVEIAHRISSSTDSRFLCFVFIRTSVEKPDSHKYVEGKGSRILMAILDTLGYNLNILHQKGMREISANISLALLSVINSINSSCSAGGMESTSTLKGFLVSLKFLSLKILKIRKKFLF